MVNVALKGARIAVAAVIGCLGAALIAVSSAYALYYAHGEAAAASSSKGVIEVCCTLDETAQGEGVTTSLIIVPAGSTAADCAALMIASSESQNGLEAIHDYGYAPIAEKLAGKSWNVSVYEAGSQEPGTQVTHATEGEKGENVELERYDNVVFTVE